MDDKKLKNYNLGNKNISMDIVNYSLVIPTHNRQFLFELKKEYYEGFKKFKVYIVDSSQNKYEGSFSKNIEYIHLPGYSFIQKMFWILELLQTKYVAVCADDDYLIEEAAYKIAIKLELGSYVMGVGEYLGYDIPYQGMYEIYPERPNAGCRYPLLRVIGLMSNYYMSLWSVYRREVLKDAYQSLSKSNFTNQNLIEISIGIICAIKGPIYFCNEVYGIREINNNNSDNWAKKNKTLLTEFKKESKKLFTQIFNIAGNITKKKLFIFGIITYLVSSLVRFMMKQRKAKYKKFVNIVNSPELLNLDIIVKKPIQGK